MRRFRQLGAVMVVLAATMLLTTSPAGAANSSFCWLDWGVESCTSGPLASSSLHDIYVHLVPDHSGITDTTWRAYDAANGVTVGSGALGSTERRVRISGLYGRYKVELRCTDWINLCLDGARLEQY
jgi:hypothetical protein